MDSEKVKESESSKLRLKRNQALAVHRAPHPSRTWLCLLAIAHGINDKGIKAAPTAQQRLHKICRDTRSGTVDRESTLNNSWRTIVL